MKSYLQNDVRNVNVAYHTMLSILLLTKNLIMSNVFCVKSVVGRLLQRNFSRVNKDLFARIVQNLDDVNKTRSNS
jgi:hypothetical protein